MHIIGIAGSLRRASLNRALLTAAIELAPSSLTIEIHTLEGVPLFDPDTEATGETVALAALREAFRSADGMLFATPEYNASVPGVLKNAIDCLSRPHGRSALRGKPAGIIGASPGAVGTARAQAHLRTVLSHAGMPVMSVPEVFVGLARERFDAEGRLIDPKTREVLGRCLAALAVWVERNRSTRD